MKPCEHCGGAFEPKTPRQVMCSLACRKAWAKTPAGRAYARACNAKYRKSEKGQRPRKFLGKSWRDRNPAGVATRAEWLKTPEGRADARRRKSKQYAAKRAAGVCVTGGCHSPAEGGHARCRECHEAFAAWRRGYDARRRKPAPVPV